MAGEGQPWKKPRRKQLCERPPVEGLGTCSTQFRASLVGESDRFRRARRLTIEVDPSHRIRVAHEIQQALGEVGRRDERREREKEEDSTVGGTHLVGRGVGLEQAKRKLYILRVGWGTSKRATRFPPASQDPERVEERYRTLTRSS